MGLIRILLALAVLFEHALGPFRPLYGPLAVQGFYLISGFYIQLIVSGRYFTPGSPASMTQLSNFYKSRLMRLLPTYYLCAAVMLALLVVAGDRMQQGRILANFLAEADVASRLLVVVGNLFILGSDVIMRFLAYDPALDTFVYPFTPPLSKTNIAGSYFLLIPQSWSLALEIMFYLMAPFLLRRRLRVLLLVIMASFAVRWHLPGHGLAGQPWINSFFPAELAMFLLGSLACRFWQRFLDDRPVGIRAAKWGWALVALLTLYVLFYRQLPGGLEAMKYWVFLLLLWLSLPLIFHASRTSGYDRWVGELSYPVYLVHFIFVYVVRHFVPDPAVGAALIALGSLVAAIFIVRFVDEPVMRYRHRKYLGKED